MAIITLDAQPDLMPGESSTRVTYSSTPLPPASGLVCLLLGCTFAASAATYRPIAITPPKPAQEMRAAWIATVANIDWPSTNNLTTEQQKAEFVNIVERAAQLKLNTLIFQVRPACDALYASSIEPWSEYLTGSMGEAPKPYYDPLKFAIEEAHKRGLELHAWFNPYRARHAAAKSPAGATHISRTHPEFVRKYGKALWLDPGERAVQDYSLRVVMDVVRRYDIDGVHFDDYFYPYKEQDAAGKDLDFPDEASWRRYGAGGKLSRDDWRRENVNAFIQRVYQSVKSAKPWVKFGVSPFGIWRPGNPRQIQGYDAYAKLYADSRKWLVNGWVDYFAPQLYWSISAPEQSFPVLLKWWEEQNPKRRHLVPGMDSTRTLRSWPPQEIVNQILLTRKQPGTSGHVLWNMKSVMQNERLSEALAHEVYVQPALIPALPWLQRVPPAKPKLSAAPSGAKAEVTWLPGKPGEAWLWVFQTRRGGKWSTQILPAAEQTQVLTQPLPEIISVSAVDRFGNMSRATALQVVKN